MKLQTNDAAQVLKVSSDWIRKLHNAGILKAERTKSGVRLFDEEDVKQLAKQRTQRAMLAAAKKKR